MALPAKSGKGHGSNAVKKAAPQPTKRASLGRGAKVSKTR